MIFSCEISDKNFNYSTYFRYGILEMFKIFTLISLFKIMFITQYKKKRKGRKISKFYRKKKLSLCAWLKKLLILRK